MAGWKWGAILIWLSACGGGKWGAGAGDAGTAPDPNAWRGPVANIFALAPQPGTTTGLMPADRPSGAVGLAGGFGARIGGTDRALYGAAHMEADFAAARVSGWIDQAGIYAVGTGVPLSRASPNLQENLAGRLVMDGAIQTAPPAGEAMWYDASYTGTLTGAQTTLRVTARTDRGAFLRSDTGIAALGSVTGTVGVTDAGGARTEVLREGSTYVQQPRP